MSEMQTVIRIYNFTFEPPLEPVDGYAILCYQLSVIQLNQHTPFILLLNKYCDTKTIVVFYLCLLFK